MRTPGGNSIFRTRVHRMVLYSNPFGSGNIDRQSLPDSVLPLPKRLWYIAAQNLGTTPPFSLTAKTLRRIDP